MYILYNIILFVAAVFIAPYFLLKMIFAGKYRKSIIPKLGGRQTKILTNLKSGPRVWIHAVSVGEVTAAAPIVASLRMKKPGVKIIFSTSTETGQEMAHRFIKGADAFIYFPLDIPFVVRKIIKSANADVFVLVETELWPNFLRVCKECRMKTLMVNGRISSRSYKRYLKTAFFWRRILDNLDEAGMISVVDAERIKAIGLDSAKVKVLGNAKYDGLAAMVSPAMQKEISLRFNVREDEKFFVAGSTHEGEEKIVISVYQDILKRYPDFKLIIVPRHIERTNDVVNLLQQATFNDFIKLSDINNGRLRTDERIIIVDVIGELFKVYSLATIVYCGGSLVPKGGQNILEAAAWGKVIFYGPSMEDFSQERTLLEDVGCGITIRSEEELSRGIITLLSCPDEIINRGEKGREVVLANIGASARYADLIGKYI
ncbi:3-deoxy-d-manno-octulosonic-acid transferase [hydrocarbon metagenome]|uniref:3-deoxy-d-manno-octulosonic-acid transferase n=1 Tax=hydrocarbon metagenome TaxID=938273 RepID=A0A0W8FN69_9ZZZZ